MMAGHAGRGRRGRRGQRGQAESGGGETGKAPNPKASAPDPARRAKAELTPGQQRITISEGVLGSG